jgi:4-amino-4-deoxy-L-arabinose transferase-like glycosyltransferase
MLPWSLFIPRAVAATFRRADCRFFILWSAIVFVFFSVSGSKLPPYILPVFPALSIPLGILFHESRASRFRRHWEIVIYAFLMAIFAFSCLLYFSRDFMAYIADISMDATSITLDLRYFSLWVSLTSAVCLVLFFFRSFRDPKRLFIILLLSLSPPSLPSWPIPGGGQDQHGQKLALAAAELKTQPDIVVNYSGLDLTIPFYLKRPVVIASYKGELAMGAKYDDARKIFMEEEEFFRLLGSDRKVLFITKSKRLENLEKRFPGRIRTHLCQNDRCLLSNY